MVFISNETYKGQPIVSTDIKSGGSLTQDDRLSTTTPMIHYEQPIFKPIIQESKSRNFDKQEPIPIHGAGVDMLNAIDFRTSKRKLKKDGVILKV